MTKYFYTICTESEKKNSLIEGLLIESGFTSSDKKVSEIAQELKKKCAQFWLNGFIQASGFNGSFKITLHKITMEHITHFSFEDFARNEDVLIYGKPIKRK